LIVGGVGVRGGAGSSKKKEKARMIARLDREAIRRMLLPESRKRKL